MANLTVKQRGRHERLAAKIADAERRGLTFYVQDLKKEKAMLDAVLARKTKQHVYRDQHDAHVKTWGAQIVTRRNLMSGVEYQERRDTPGFLSPSRESYWTM